MATWPLGGRNDPGPPCYLHAQQRLGLPGDVLDGYMRHDGRAVVMFDGLDELFDPTQRADTARRITAFAAAYPRVRVIVTSRADAAVVRLTRAPRPPPRQRPPAPPLSAGDARQRPPAPPLSAGDARRARSRPLGRPGRRRTPATGATTHRRSGTALDELTPQELQVAQMLAGGRTTREAAAALFLSPKTVEYHLRHVYMKLGIRSRAELAGGLDARP